MLAQELDKLHREVKVRENQSMQAVISSRQSFTRENSREKQSEIDKIFGVHSFHDELKEYEEKKNFEKKLMVGRFFGPPSSEHNDTILKFQNNRDTFKLHFFQATLNLYNRIVSIMESIICESSSTHHTSDFISICQKHILLGSKMSNTTKMLHELMNQKHNVAHPLETLFDDYIHKLSGKNDTLRKLWKWTVCNSKIMIAILKRVKVVEIFEENMREGGGRNCSRRLFHSLGVFHRQNLPDLHGEALRGWKEPVGDIAHVQE